MGEMEVGGGMRCGEDVEAMTCDGGLIAEVITIMGGVMATVMMAMGSNG